ncbi:MAG: hypothetical protein R2741_12345 [Methanolobus sp.]
MFLKKRVKWLAVMLTISFLVSFSGCLEDTVDEKTMTNITLNSIASAQQPRVTEGFSGETIIVPENIHVREWKIVVDRLSVTIENTGDSAVFLKKVNADVSFDSDMSTFRHYEASIDTMLAPGDEKTVYIRIHKLSDWDKPNLKTIEVIEEN